MRDYCERMFGEISANYSSVIDEAAIERWLLMQASHDRLKPSPKRDDGSQPLAIESLLSHHLLRTYDLDGKGYLTEDEALLMMADISELHTPDDTMKLNALLTRMSDVTRSLDAPLVTIEDRLLAATEAFHDIDHYRQSFRLSEEPSRYNVPRPTISIAALRRTIHSLVSRQGWTAPTPDGSAARRPGFGRQGTLRRLPSSKILPVGQSGSPKPGSGSAADAADPQRELSEAEESEERANIAAADRLFQRWAEEDGPVPVH
jgi:hypothetical protein